MLILCKCLFGHTGERTVTVDAQPFLIQRIHFGKIVFANKSGYSREKCTPSTSLELFRSSVAVSNSSGIVFLSALSSRSISCHTKCGGDNDSFNNFILVTHGKFNYQNSQMLLTTSNVESSSTSLISSSCSVSGSLIFMAALATSGW